jgi:hypothetical protein
MSGNIEQLEPEAHRMRTRGKNVDTHPGEKFKEASRSRQPPRPREVIQKEKEEKAAIQQARAQAKSLKEAGEQRATQLDKEKRTMAALEDEQIPRRLPLDKKGMWRNSSSFTFATNVLQVEQPQGADAKTDNAPELMKKRKKNNNIQSDEDTRKGNRAKKSKTSHKERQAFPVPQAKRPYSPTDSVSEKTNYSIEKTNILLTRNRMGTTLTNELISEQCQGRRENVIPKSLSLFAAMVCP